MRVLPLLALGGGIALLLVLFVALACAGEIETETATLLSTTLLVGVTAYYAIHTQVIAEQARRQADTAEKTLTHLQQPLLVLVLVSTIIEEDARWLCGVNVGEAAALRPSASWDDGAESGVKWARTSPPDIVIPYGQRPLPGSKPSSTGEVAALFSFCVPLSDLPDEGYRMLRVKWEDPRAAQECSQLWAIGLPGGPRGVFVIEPQGAVERKPIELP